LEIQYKDITGFKGDSLKVPLLLAALALHDPKYFAASEQLGGKSTAEILLLQSKIHFKD
jgi:hypothetical protein